MNYVYDNVICQTIGTLSNVKAIGEEEAKAKYERVVITSLMGYALYLKKTDDGIDENDDGCVIDLDRKIVDDRKFWKMSKYDESNGPNNNRLRGSWYTVLSVILQRAPRLLNGHEKDVCDAVFNHLDDNDPSVSISVWESALLIVNNVRVRTRLLFFFFDFHYFRVATRLFAFSFIHLFFAFAELVGIHERGEDASAKIMDDIA